MNTRSRLLSSPVGDLLLVATDEALTEVHFPPHRGTDTPALAHPILDRAARELGEYFAGERRDFEVPQQMKGTPFQQQVWAALREIPYGGFRSYGDIARTIGRPTASRAVGAANGQNPLPIIVPCHRVIGSSGALTGFGGGLPRKQWLLQLEAKVTNRVLTLT